LVDDKNGLKKAILRKSTRQIDAGVSWRVFKRDEYTCRYCGKDDVPLTVDHLVLWEKGGPTIEDNLVACCKKCNKKRGNMKYEDWLVSDYYKKVSKNLSAEIRELNCVTKFSLSTIPIKYHVISRGSKKNKKG
jgi:5-methylcytosine-specific restriction endonuclease McrA